MQQQAESGGCKSPLIRGSPQQSARDILKDANRRYAAKTRVDRCGNAIQNTDGQSGVENGFERPRLLTFRNVFKSGFERVFLHWVFSFLPSFSKVTKHV